MCKDLLSSGQFDHVRTDIVIDLYSLYLFCERGSLRFTSIEAGVIEALNAQIHLALAAFKFRLWLASCAIFNANVFEGISTYVTCKV